MEMEINGEASQHDIVLLFALKYRLPEEAIIRYVSIFIPDPVSIGPAGSSTVQRKTSRARLCSLKSAEFTAGRSAAP
jgi:hypothetical protein